MVSNQLLSNAAHFLSIQGIFTDLTFDLYFRMYVLTSDLNITVENTKFLCMKFICLVYVTLRIEFPTKCSLLQVQTRHFKDFDLWHWPLTLKKLSTKLETYFFEVLIQSWSRKTISPTINMNFPRKLHKLPDYLYKTSLLHRNLENVKFALSWIVKFILWRESYL